MEGLEAQNIHLGELVGKSDVSHTSTKRARVISNQWRQANEEGHHAEPTPTWAFSKCSMPSETEKVIYESNSTTEHLQHQSKPSSHLDR